MSKPSATLIGSYGVMIAPEDVAGISDLSYFFQGDMTPAERVIEWAGRTCYRSNDKMGYAPDFIGARIREQHLDILEHAFASILFQDCGDLPELWAAFNRYLVVFPSIGGEYVVSGNLRVWRDLLASGRARVAGPVLAALAPSIFKEWQPLELSDPPSVKVANPVVTVGDARVTFLSFGGSLWEVDLLNGSHAHAAFMLEGVSRSLTHQLVRHRLLSFSQESQRYVELSKGGWSAIVPPAVSDNPEALAEMQEFWQIAEQKYTRLRELGIRKEDARFLLPNAAESRLVVSGPLPALKIFFEQRAADKAAQWEIRQVGGVMLDMLAEIVSMFEPLKERKDRMNEERAGKRD